MFITRVICLPTGLWAYFGPDGLMESRGAPKRVDRTAAAKDQATATRLWDLSEELTGVHYETVRPNSSTS